MSGLTTTAVQISEKNQDDAKTAQMLSISMGFPFYGSNAEHLGGVLLFWLVRRNAVNAKNNCAHKYVNEVRERA